MENLGYLIGGQIINFLLFVWLIKYIRKRKYESNSSFSKKIDNIVSFSLFLLLFIFSYIFWHSILNEIKLSHPIIISLSGILLFIIFIFYLFLGNKKNINIETLDEIIKDIIYSNDLHLNLSSNVDKEMIDHFLRSKNEIILSQLQVLKLYFIREIFLQFMRNRHLSLDSIERVMGYVDTELMNLNLLESNFENIDNLLEEYDRIIKGGGGQIGADILFILSGNDSYNPLDWIKIRNYINSNLKLVNQTIVKLENNKNLTSVFSSPSFFTIFY